MKMKKVLALALSSAMVLSLGACGNSGSAAQSEGSDSGQTAAVSYPGTPDTDMVTVDLRSEPAELNSLKTSDVPSGDILREVVSGLYKLDENDNPVLDLAAEEPQVSEDGCTYTIKLRQDAKWSNGEPVTANDFVYAYQQVCNPDTGSVYAFILYQNLVNGQEVYEGTKDPSELGVKAIDDYTLEVTFVNPIPYAKHLFSFSTFMPVNQKAYEEFGGADGYAKEADTIVTNGPYKITEWVHEDHITLEKNPDYYGADDIQIEKIKYVMMKDTNARMNAFKAGQVDCINLDGDQMAQLEKDGVEVQTYVDNGNWYFQYNTNTPGLNNAKIRQALGMSIDLESLCTNVRKDGSVPATGLVPTGINGADGQKYREAAGDMITYDAEQAKKLFEEGLAEEGMTAADFKISLLTDDTSAAQKEAAFYQEQWKQALGIEVEITPQPFKSRLQSMEDRDFDIVFAGWAPDYNDPMTYLDMFTTTNGNNYGDYSSEEYDTLIANAMKEVDPVKRQEMLIQAETLLVQTDAPIFPLYFSSVGYVVSDKLDGMTRTGFQEFDFTDGAVIK